MTEPARLSPDEQDEAIRSVCMDLLAAAPVDWQELRYTMLSTVEVDSISCQVVHADGAVLQGPTPRSVEDPLNDLRDGMYLPGKGTWYTIRITITRPGSYTVDYDYDTEPAFVPQLVPGSYALDLERYPRTEDNIPDWLREMVAQA